ncbi:hypothetical protein BGZ73_007559 [Actinomortierella ambigua]|nr:hypothetical protein BGZ73_007559 [Actinomortierella ambigua]
MQGRHNRCQSQSSDRRGGKRRKYSRCTAVFLLAASVCLSFNPAQAAPIHETRYPSPVQPIKRQDSTPSPLPGGGGGDGEIDPCTALSKVFEPEISYDLVRACFENIPYNATEANAILTTLYTFYKDFYIFVDSAQQPQQQKPFTNPPVDILVELRKLGQRTFANDFEFHREVDLVVNKLNDAHANYMPECYQHYLYIQPFDLYAPVIDGVQTVKILNDNYSPAGHPYQDCTVLTIDGEEALSYIQKWIDAHFGFSKDAGVRLNKALTQLIFSTDKMDWIFYSGQFTTRSTLPEKGEMVFKLRCDKKAGGNGTTLVHKRGSESKLAQEVDDVQEGQGRQEEEEDGEEDEEEKEEKEEEGVETLSIPWSIFRLVSWKEFEDTPSFIQANCLPLPPETTNPSKEDPQPLVEEENNGETDDKNDDENNGNNQEDDNNNDDDKNLLQKIEEEIEKEVEEIEEMVDDILNNHNSNNTELPPEDTPVGSHANINRQHTKRVADSQKHIKRSVSDLQGEYYAQSMARQARTTLLERRQFPNLPLPNERAARLIFNGTSAGFFQLVKRPEIGVVVIPSHMVDHQKEAKHLTDGFEQLHQHGVKKVVLDLTANGGGYVNFAYDLIDWMFPNETRTSVYESDLRSSMSIKALADRDLLDDDYDGYYSPNAFSDPATGLSYETNFFLNDRVERRVRSALGYTTRVRMNHDLGKFELGMPWQHHAQDMVLLTDGACGSACGMTLNRLKNRHGVASYAIGGRVGEDLSLFSFAGASVYGLDDLLTDFEKLGVDAPMRRMRYRGIYRVPVMEFFQEDDPVPIEYHPSLYKADFHLDYTPETARNHERFWELVADNHWKP